MLKLCSTRPKLSVPLFATSKNFSFNQTYLACTQTLFPLSFWQKASPEREEKEEKEKKNKKKTIDLESVPSDQVFPLLVFNYVLSALFFYKKIRSLALFSSLRIVFDCVYLLIFYFEKFSTWVYVLLFAVNFTLNLSIPLPPPSPPLALTVNKSPAVLFLRAL